MYSYNTAGPFGLEDQVRTSGPGMALIYQLLIPFFWCIPISLVAAELTTAMPVQGGFYRWTREAFGDFWGFLAGWWNWCASFLLGALYEQVSSVAEEVENPQRNYPLALAWVVPMSMATYLLPTACALAALGDWEKWNTGYFSQAATLIGGPVLGFVITAAAAVMNLS